MKNEYLNEDDLISDYVVFGKEEAFNILYKRFLNLKEKILKNEIYYIDLESLYDDCFFNAVNKFTISKENNFYNFLINLIKDELILEIKKYLEMNYKNITFEEYLGDLIISNNIEDDNIIYRIFIEKNK